MPFEQLLCPGCGADLDVPEGVTVLKCQFCKSKLKLAESETVRALTLLKQGIAEVAQHGARAADGIDALRAETEAARRRTFNNWQFQRDVLVSDYASIDERHKQIAKSEGKQMGYFTLACFAAAVITLIALAVFPAEKTQLVLLLMALPVFWTIVMKVLNDSNTKARAGPLHGLRQ